ncbi:conserved hypothetical protein [Leishmania infantum JPCM5]|uniref:Uncharacterized protein n=2 Tax=Leishmania infantum TaxID=5671 RepID=A4I0L8_LEIIN|nr:conserved hypothetical protein [Leishmania infantum JPCM5]CAC9490372.1 hypothetical_protein_-_conserved [Leishmania infantum]CAM68290.1 conserved hypothetical protein [Leishmania infantum JPCM5]SUZ42068.1 hypothetical_protein_-_conserved [Leishmania infantum]|eukprot:XP_001465859.1 conserved hypothetical protein [Leishmania infantum JPCM5]
MEILKKTAAFRVQKQVEGRPAEEVTQLSLSGVPALPELWSPYTHLTHLLLICMKPKLVSLDILDLNKLQALRLLDVSDNAVAVTSPPPAVPSLVRLLMPNNQVSSLEEVSRLAQSFPNLEVLDVVDNDVDTPAHFASVFGAFPKLVALNSRTRDGTEVVVEDSDETDSDEEFEDSSDEESDDEVGQTGSSGSTGSETEEESEGDAEPTAKRTRTEDEKDG